MNKTHLAPQVEWKEICSGSIPPLDAAERLQGRKKKKKKKPIPRRTEGADESEQKIDESWIPMLGQQAFHICACFYSSSSLSSITLLTTYAPIRYSSCGMCMEIWLTCTPQAGMEGWICCRSFTAECCLSFRGPFIPFPSICSIMNHLSGITVILLWNLKTDFFFLDKFN